MAQQSGRAPDFRGEPFLNPYTFVPAFPRDGFPESVDDGEPYGNDRLRPGLWTGTIGVRLTVRTPLLLLDAARAFEAESGSEGHLAYPLLARNGLPHLPATSVKGMLRSAYEAITGSRFGVFTGHNLPPGWRRPAEDGARMKPVRVLSVSEKPDRVRIEYCEQARLPAYELPEKRVKPLPYQGTTRLPRHGEAVTVRIGRKSGRRGGRSFFKPWTVRSIVPRGEGEPARGDWGDDEEKVVNGYVWATLQNTVGKVYERVFFQPDHPRTVVLEGQYARWNALMADYAAAHTHEDLRARGEGDGLAWSPHLRDPARARLEPGALCWAYQRSGGADLYPVMIPRALAALAPKDMLPDDLRPARAYEKLSPADRLFGWVAADDANTFPAAYRGQVRIKGVRCEEETASVTRFVGDGLPLAILGGPKPAQGRFYRAKSPTRPDEPLDDGVPRGNVHLDEGQGLRGRKVYWHHARVAGDREYWREPADGRDPTQDPLNGRDHREFRRPWGPVDGPGGETQPRPDGRAHATRRNAEQRDNQNRSICGWIDGGSGFSFSIDVRDLDGAELGALLWLLELPDGCFHRLGFGKPLGFGSVRLTLDNARTTLHKGERWQAYYRDLGGELPPSTAPQEARAEYADLRTEVPAIGKAAEAFLIAARGFDLPVRYPRVRDPRMRRAPTTPPDPSGQNYSWFTINEKISKGGGGQRGRSLPSTVDAKRKALRTHMGERRQQG